MNIRSPCRIECDADAFHQMGEQDLRGGPCRCARIDRRAVHGVAARRIAAVGPVQHALREIELEVDRLGQAVEQHLDVAAIGGALAPAGCRCRRGRCGPVRRCPGPSASSRCARARHRRRCRRTTSSGRGDRRRLGRSAPASRRSSRRGSRASRACLRDPTSRACRHRLSSWSCFGVNVAPSGTIVVRLRPSRSARSIEPSLRLGTPMLVQ